LGRSSETNANEAFVPVPQDRQKPGQMSRSTCCGTVFVIYFCAMTQLSHVDNQGRIRMVDTGSKQVTLRRAGGHESCSYGAVPATDASYDERMIDSESVLPTSVFT